MPHPSWVRGLKYLITSFRSVIVRPHPSWVRGLKLHQQIDGCPHKGAAPFMGAWIEISPSVDNLQKVASRTLHGCVD